MKNFTTLIVDMVKQNNLFASEGGPIILAQIENEYGNVINSYGNEGKSYINWYHIPHSFLNYEDNTLVLFEEFGGNTELSSVQTVTVGKVFAHAYEGNGLELSCHGSSVRSKINFASFGHPNGTYGSLSKGSCHSPNSSSVMEKACISKESCSVDISERTFGHSGCESPLKRLAVEVECWELSFRCKKF